MDSQGVVHPVVRVAQMANRVLTWGLPDTERREMLAELLADWEAMHLDRGSRPVVIRFIRGIPVQLWDRLVNRDITAIPAAIAAGSVRLGGLVASSPAMQYPVDHRLTIALSALGIILLSWVMAIDPRRLNADLYRWPSAVAVVGLVGMALTMPVPDDWTYEAPFVSTPQLDMLMQFSMALTAVGLALVAVFGGLSRKRFLFAGALIVTGLVLFGLTEIA